MKYGELELKKLHELGVEFAHYTLRRGRAKKLHDMKGMPKSMWKDGVGVDDPIHFAIYDNNGLTIAPTANHDIEYPLGVSVKFNSKEQAEAVTDELYAQGLEIKETLPLEGMVIISGDGTWAPSDKYGAQPVVDVKEVQEKPVVPLEKPEVQEKPKVKEVKAKSQSGAAVGDRLLVTQKTINDLFGLNFGDLIEVYDAYDNALERYIYIMGYSCVPRLKNVRTEKDIDLFFLTDHPYSIVRKADKE